MADEEVATKAPESDAQEKSAIPGDTMVDQGASMGVSLAYTASRDSTKKYGRSTA